MMKSIHIIKYLVLIGLLIVPGILAAEKNPSSSTAVQPLELSEINQAEIIPAI